MEGALEDEEVEMAARDAQMRADEALARELQAQMAEETPLMRHGALWHQRSNSGSMADSAVPAGIGIAAAGRARPGGNPSSAARGIIAATGGAAGGAGDAGAGSGGAGGGQRDVPAEAAGAAAGAAGQVPVRVNAANVAARAFDQQRLFVVLLIFVNLPQVAAAVVVLAMHWTDDDVCDAAHRSNWRLWATVQAVRLLLHTGVSVALLLLGPEPGAAGRGRSVRVRRARARAATLLQSAKSGLEAVGLVWFVLGNMLLFSQSDESDGSCEHPDKSPIYRLCVAMIVISYIQLCAPCLLAILMIPVLCFCLPCLIRLLNSLQESAGFGRGAPTAVIDSIPLVRFSDRQSEIEETQCSICLSDYDAADMLRLLPCKHAFHRACVDDWLRLNATCPNCRASISGGGIDDDEDLEAAEAAEAQRATAALRGASRAVGDAAA